MPYSGCVDRNICDEQSKIEQRVRWPCLIRYNAFAYTVIKFAQVKGYGVQSWDTSSDLQKLRHKVYAHEGECEKVDSGFDNFREIATNSSIEVGDG
jgi:hypothetical protein